MSCNILLLKLNVQTLLLDCCKWEDLLSLDILLNIDPFKDQSVQFLMK
jgi:hypothetical protein